jgi:hypothetical protein
MNLLYVGGELGEGVQCKGLQKSTNNPIPNLTRVTIMTTKTDEGIIVIKVNSTANLNLLIILGNGSSTIDSSLTAEITIMILQH